MGSSASRRQGSAGVVVVRGDPTAPEVLMVRQGPGDNWRLPVTAVGPDEYLAGCAARAARTDAGVAIRLGIPIALSPSREGVSPVAWWRAQATTDEIPSIGEGINDVAWVRVEEATGRVAGTEEELVIRRGAALADTIPILILRHAKAMARTNWSGRDQARPLNAIGRRQSGALGPLLSAYGVGRLASSTSTRCVKTLVPFATAEHLEIEGWATLSEEQAERNLKTVDKLMRRLIDQTLQSRQPLAICGHRPVLPSMLAALGIPARQLKPGACVVAHLDAGGHRLAFEHHPPRP